MAGKDVNLKNTDDKLDKDVKFTPEQQAKIDEIVKNRLERQSKSLNEKVKELEEKSIDKIAENLGVKAEEVESLLKGTVNEKKLEEVAEQAAKLGVSPEFLVKVNDLTNENKILKKERQDRIEAEAKREKEKALFAEQEKEFEEKFPEIDLSKLNKDTNFLNLYKKMGKDVSLVDAYSTYAEIAGDVKSREIASALKKEKRSVGSGGEDIGGGDYDGLTKEQIALCKENEIDPKDFKRNLKRSAYYNGK